LWRSTPPDGVAEPFSSPSLGLLAPVALPSILAGDFPPGRHPAVFFLREQKLVLDDRAGVLIKQRLVDVVACVGMKAL